MEIEPPMQLGRYKKANVIRAAPGVTRYASSLIHDIKSCFETIFQRKIIEMTNIEGKRVYKEEWKDIYICTFQAYVGLLLLAARMMNLQRIYGIEKEEEIFFEQQCPVKIFIPFLEFFSLMKKIQD